MQLPPRAILRSIDDWAVIFFKDALFSKDAPPHFYVIIPIDQDVSYVVCIITSQIRKKKAYYQRANPKALRSLVHVDQDMLPFLSGPSLVECNKAELLSVEELTKRVHANEGLEIKDRNIPTPLKRDIASAILQSPLVVPKLKKQLKQLLKARKSI